jgi:phage I-like protein
MSKKNKGNLTFSDVVAVSADDPFQKIIPYGVFETAKYGKIEFNLAFCQKIVAHWKAKVMGNRQPFVDVNHNRGEAQGWLTELEARADGLYAAIEWTPPGKDKVASKTFRYFSADITEAQNILDGKSYWPVLAAVSLTNVPVLNVLPDVKLGELTTGGEGLKLPPSPPPTDSTHSDGAEGNPQNRKESPMDFEKILAFLKAQSAGLTPEQKKAVADALGLTAAPSAEELAAEKKKAADACAASEKAVAASEDLKAKLKLAEDTAKELRANAEGRHDQSLALAERLKVLEAKLSDTERESVIGSALKAGKIKPADKEKWEKRFADSPKATAEILGEMPANPAFSETGTGGTPAALEFSEKEIELQQRMGGYTREQAVENLKKHGGASPPAK